jgi:hypothetical protein
MPLRPPQIPPDLSSNLGCRGGKPETNRLSCRTAKTGFSLSFYKTWNGPSALPASLHDWLRAGLLNLHSEWGWDIFSPPPRFCSPSSLLSNRYLQFSVIRLTEHEFVYSSPHSTEVNNSWSFTSTTSYALMVWCQITSVVKNYVAKQFANQQLSKISGFQLEDPDSNPSGETQALLSSGRLMLASINAETRMLFYLCAHNTPPRCVA